MFLARSKCVPFWFVGWVRVGCRATFGPLEPSATLPLVGLVRVKMMPECVLCNYSAVQHGCVVKRAVNAGCIPISRSPMPLWAGKCILTGEVSPSTPLQGSHRCQRDWLEHYHGGRETGQAARLDSLDMFGHNNVALFLFLIPVYYVKLGRPNK